MKALAKKRNRKTRQGDPFAIAPTPRREKDGRVKRSTRDDYERDASVVALKARCRMAGWVETELAKARSQSMEGQAGLAINIGAKDGKERDRLWTVYIGLDGAEATYFRRILGRSRHAKTAKIEMMPETFEARPDDKPDLRDDDTKDRDAVNNWMRWRGYMGHLRADERQYIHGALMDNLGLIAEPKVDDFGQHQERELSTSGRAFLAALRVLADVVENRATR